MPTKRKTRAKKPADQHPELIKAEIRMRGMTLSRLATDNGLSESAIRAALIRPQPKADRVISRFLGVPLHELWPTRYDAEGLRIRHVRDDNTPVRAAPHRLSTEAA